MWGKNKSTISAISVAIVVVVVVMQTRIAAVAHDNQIVNANIITRVLHLKVGNSIGTAFTIEVDKKQYLITAKHLTGETQIEELEIWQRG